MRTLLRLAPALVLLGIVMAAAASAPTRPSTGPWTLAYRLVGGTVLRYRLVADVSGKIPMPTSPEPVDANASVSVIYRVMPLERRPDGAVKARLRVESVDVQLEKVPLALPLEDAQRYLDRDVIVSPTGETTLTGDAAPPIKLAIPGVDPQRLYTLLFPVVFLQRPVKVGDTWPYQGGLLGGPDAPARFEATVARPAAAAEPQRNAPRDRRKKAVPPTAGPVVPLRERFSMDVDQDLDANKAPVAAGTSAHWHRTGTIKGEGTLQFDRVRGRFTRGTLDVAASMIDRALGNGPAEGPSEIAATLKARLRMELLPPAARAASPASPRPKETQ